MACGCGTQTTTTTTAAPVVSSPVVPVLSFDAPPTGSSVQDMVAQAQTPAAARAPEPESHGGLCPCVVKRLVLAAVVILLLFD